MSGPPGHAVKLINISSCVFRGTDTYSCNVTVLKWFGPSSGGKSVLKGNNLLLLQAHIRNKDYGP